MRYCGREFTVEEIAWINEQAAIPGMRRTRLSKLFCERFDWYKFDGGLKAMSCRVAFLRMEKDGLIKLPPSIQKHPRVPFKIKRTLFGQPRPELHKPVGQMNLRLELVNRGTTALWNELIDRYHYLGYKPLPGAQLRYFINDGGDSVALLGFGAAAWTVAPRDRWIGWTHEQRKRNLHLVVNQARFLILPWVHSKNLASRIQSYSSKRLPGDWEFRYGYRPVLFETFVRKDKFRGTCYKAANWRYVGDTKGRGKLGKKKPSVPVKSIWLYPLTKTFRRQLKKEDE